MTKIIFSAEKSKGPIVAQAKADCYQRSDSDIHFHSNIYFTSDSICYDFSL